MRWIVFLVGLLVAVPAAAQPKLLQAHASGSPPTYTGPIDIVASPTALYSLRAGSAAIAAAGTQTIINIRRASDNVACDFLPASTGGFGVTTSTCNSSTQGGVSYGTFVGTDTTCTASISGTTLTLGVGACTTPLHVNDVLSGAGLTNPVFITAIGTCGSNTATNTCTLNLSQGVIASETIVAQVAGFATKVYDQTVGNACAGATSCDVVQATAGNQPQFLSNCVNSAPCLVSNVAAGSMSSANTFTPNAAHQLTLSAVLQQQTTTTGVFYFEMNGANNYMKHQSGIANKWQLGVGGSNVSLSTANEGVWHAANAVEVAGTNATIFNIDGVEVTATATPNSTAGVPLIAGGGSGSLVYFTEGYFYDNLVFTSGNRTSMCRNQQAYYGAGNFGAAC